VDRGLGTDGAVVIVWRQVKDCAELAETISLIDSAIEIDNELS
jgi:hypothetical protein